MSFASKGPRPSRSSTRPCRISPPSWRCWASRTRCRSRTSCSWPRATAASACTVRRRSCWKRSWWNQRSRRGKKRSNRSKSSLPRRPHAAGPRAAPVQEVQGGEGSAGQIEKEPWGKGIQVHKEKILLLEDQEIYGGDNVPSCSGPPLCVSSGPRSLRTRTQRNCTTKRTSTRRTRSTSTPSN